MSIKHFFYWSYWFSQPYIARDWLAIVLWVGAGGVFLLGIILYIVRQYQADHLKQEVWRRYAQLALTAGVVSIIWVAFRQQRIPWLAWRFWLVIASVVFIWRLVIIIRYTRDRLPAIKTEQASRERRERYLPKRKR